MQAETDLDVKGLRLSLGESQAEFGGRFGVDQSTIHRWETRGVPRRGAARVAIERLVGEVREVSQ